LLYTKVLLYLINLILFLQFYYTLHFNFMVHLSGKKITL